MFTLLLAVIPWRLMLYSYKDNLERCLNTNYLAMNFGKTYAIGQSKGDIWKQACERGDDDKPEGFPWNAKQPE